MKVSQEVRSVQIRYRVRGCVSVYIEVRIREPKDQQSESISNKHKWKVQTSQREKSEERGKTNNKRIEEWGELGVIKIATTLFEEYKMNIRSQVKNSRWEIDKVLLKSLIEALDYQALRVTLRTREPSRSRSIPAKKM